LLDFGRALLDEARIWLNVHLAWKDIIFNNRSQLYGQARARLG
jgi:hypothetical protein